MPLPLDLLRPLRLSELFFCQKKNEGEDLRGGKIKPCSCGTAVLEYSQV